MKKMSNFAKLAVVAAIGFSAIGVAQSADALTYSQKNGTYVQDRLPNGVVTGPIAPDANGG
jgi:hypothetical protein